MPPVYSLDNVINRFFESESIVTRQECDEFSVSLVGEPVIPVPIQGASSYTVTAGAEQIKIVQFRAQSSVLDMEALVLARTIHGQFVAQCTYYGTIGQSSPLAVYVIHKLPGVNYIQARCINGLSAESSTEAILRQSNTAADFARFFAAYWKHRQTKNSHIVEAIRRDCQRRIDILSQALPSRFTKTLSEVRAELPSLFASTYPLVLTHDDLCEMNILLDPDAGHISGVIDWAEAKILPFGIILWGFQNILGYMDSKGWHYYRNHHNLETLFWQTFDDIVGGVPETDRHAIHATRTAGFSSGMGLSGITELEKDL